MIMATNHNIFTNYCIRVRVDGTKTSIAHLGGKSFPVVTKPE